MHAYLLIKGRVSLLAIIMIQRHICLVNDMQGYVQLLGQHCQRVAVNASQDAATEVCCCRHTATLHTSQVCSISETEGAEANALTLIMHG